MIQIQQLKLHIGHTPEDMEHAILRQLKIKKAQLLSYEIVKRSIDARKKPRLQFVYTINVEVAGQEQILRCAKNPSIRMITPEVYQIPACGDTQLKHRPVIVGFGPAGMFCGLLLARAGFCPIILERGAEVDIRQQKVNAFWQTGELDLDSNVQFGEGGAGTFSDGKLNTSVKDPFGRNRFVLKTFVEAGAPEDILWLNKPHVGTDVLCQVVKGIRWEIIRLGGEVRFMNKVTNVCVSDGRVTAVEVNHTEILPVDVLVMAIGHSARDTFEMLDKKPLVMKAKAFAVGVRIEHPQEMIDISQYSMPHGDIVPAAEYKLTRKLSNGRGVYSFCMCPGGYVVNASSEKGMTAVNGMSYHARDGVNANSAIVVTVTPEDFVGDDALSGMRFQRKLEEQAYVAGQGNVPVQLFEDFCERRMSKGLGDIVPQIKGNYVFGNLHECFPPELHQSLSEGIGLCGNIITGFSRADAVLSGVESRTSSPVRIERGDDFTSRIGGLYPCGEGAGYAGGITSAAMDGIKIAEAVIKAFMPSKTV